MDTRPTTRRGMETKPAGDGGAPKWIWWVAGAIGLVILAIILWQLFDEEQSAGPEAGVTISDITDNPEEYYDSTVTVSGEVGELIGPRAFTIGTEDDLGGGEGVLVVSGDPALNLVEGMPVQVIGVFWEFDLEIFEEELGVELDEAFADWDGRPAILAAEVVPAE